MLDKARPILALTLIIIVYLSALILFAVVVNWFILFISPRVLDLACGGILLFSIGIYVLIKTWAEINTNRGFNIFRWLGLFLAIVIFIGFYRLINTLDTMGQYGCGFALFCFVLLIISPILSPLPSIIDDNEDDYHASR